MIILNEKEYVENCLKNKTLGEKPYRTMFLIAEYYSQYLGYKKKRIESELIDFVSKYYEDFKYRRLFWEDNIEKIAKKAGKHTLVEVDGVWITAKELQKIEKLNNKKLEQLAFTLLCIAKFNHIKQPDNEGWVNTDFKDVFKLARITCSVMQRCIMLNQLYNLKMLKFPRRIDNLNCCVTYMSDRGEKVLFVSDFRELGYEYLNYKGENFVRCAECGRLTRNNKNGTKKYCSDCAGYNSQHWKKVTCIDCGKEFEVHPKNTETNRCEDCYREYRRKYKTEHMRKQREMDGCGQRN